MNGKYAMIAGLNSKELTNNVLSIMDMLDVTQTMRCFEACKLLIRTTHTGDIHVYQIESISGEAAYLFQEMGSEPWQDLAALCTSVQMLKRQGVKRITAVVPIWKLGHHMDGMPYMNDRCGTQKIVADILIASGLDRLATLTPTADMLTDLYPLEIVQIDCFDKLMQMTNASGTYEPCILATEEDVLPLVQSLANRHHWSFGMCRIGKDGIFTTENVCGRDILLYTHCFGDRHFKAAEYLLWKHAESVNCYTPWLNDPHRLADAIKPASFRLIAPVNSLERFILPLPVEESIAAWMLQDRINW